MLATARVLGIDPLPWQELVWTVALEHVDGQLAYRDVAVSTSRQSGKSTLVLPLIVHRLLAAPGQRVAYGSQSRLAARTKLFDTWWPRIRRSRLAGLFELSRATGAEALRAVNGSACMLLSTDEASAHGETLDAAYLDEAWALDEAAEQAVRPAMATRRNAQLWALSTAGTTKSVFWRSKVDQGRAVAQAGETTGMAYFEWSAPDDVDVTDPSLWAGWMPALGLTIDAATVQADLAAMRLDQWRRAYGNQWPDESDDGWALISRDVWEASRL